VLPNRIDLETALDATRTGDVWLFRGRKLADRAIQVSTNSPVNHVGMAVVLKDLPPLMWHAELGRSLEDLWTGSHQRGAQIHDLREVVNTWTHRYGQRTWLRQLDAVVDREREDALLRAIARLNGTPFPSTTGMALRWLKGHLPALRSGTARDDPEMAYCAEIIAITYEAMGLLTPRRRTSGFDPGRFWSGDNLELLDDASLGREIAVHVPPAPGPRPNR
jgi:hypothetical protein